MRGHAGRRGATERQRKPGEGGENRKNEKEGNVVKGQSWGLE